MAINWPPYTESDTVTAASVNATFTLISDYANDLPPGAVERHGLRDVHLPSLYPVDLLSNGGEAWPITQEPRQVYENSLPDTAGAYPLDYQAFSSTAGSVSPVGIYGPVLTDPGGGWRIVAEDNVTTQLTGACQVDFAALNNNLDSERLKGLLVRGSVYVHEASNVGTDRAGPSVINYHRGSVLVAVGWYDGTGARHILERSIRWYSMRAIWRGEASTFAFLKQSDLDTQGNGEVARVFLAVASQWRAWPTNPEEELATTLGQYNLSVWPLHAGDLEEV